MATNPCGYVGYMLLQPIIVTNTMENTIIVTNTMQNVITQFKSWAHWRTLEP